MEDKRDILKDEKPFSWKFLKEEKAIIYWNNKPVKTIFNKEFFKLERLAEKGNSYETQLFLAKITGNFKHGNERRN